MTLYIKFILTFLLISCSIQLKCQNFIGWPTKIFYGNDIFIPRFADKNEIELSISNSAADYNLMHNYKVAYSPIKNIGIKFNFSNNTSTNVYRHNVFYFDKFTAGLGYYKSFTHHRAESKAKWKKEYLENNPNSKSIKLKYKNINRTAKGKDIRSLKSKFSRVPSFNTSIYFSYEKGNYNGIQNIYNFPNEDFRIKTSNFKSESYNIDLNFEYQTAYRFSFGYQLRIFKLRLSNFDDDNPGEELKYTLDLIKSNPNFNGVESNYKVTVSYNKFDLFAQLTDIYGVDYFIDLKPTYNVISYDASFNLGASLFLHKLFKKSL